MPDDDDDKQTEQLKKERLAQMREAQEKEGKLKSVLRNILEETAYDRLMNVKLANNDMFMHAAQVCITLFKRAGRKLTEGEILSILMRIKNSQERSTSITFERK